LGKALCAGYAVIEFLHGQDVVHSSVVIAPREDDRALLEDDKALLEQDVSCHPIPVGGNPAGKAAYK
jgi:hypothetical protein